MVENYTDLFSGHIQIHRAGFQKKISLDLSILPNPKIEEILLHAPSVLSHSRRIKDYALISSAEASSGILLIGVDPEKEKSVTRLHKRIRQGEFLSPLNNDSILIGKDLAETLNVTLGDKVVLMSQGSDGSLAAASYRVYGLLDTGAEEIDRSIALITLKAAQELLVLDDKFSEFAIRTKSIFAIDETAKSLKNQLALEDFEVLTWKEISPIIKQWLEFDRAFSNVILFIVLIVVAAGILNTMLMSVLERIKEFGIMLALGTKRSQIVLMVAIESFFLGIIGVAAGTAGGLALSKYFGSFGIDLSKFSQALESYYTGSVIYPRIFIGYVFLWSGIVLLVCVAASLYPAHKAANLKPVEAIRS